MDCLFCKIAEKKAKSDIVYEDTEILAFRDLNPQAPVHILIIPKKHIASVVDISDLDEKLAGRIITAAKLIAKKESISETGFRIVINNGPDAGQAVAHLHAHILGKRRLSVASGLIILIKERRVNI